METADEEGGSKAPLTEAHFRVGMRSRAVLLGILVAVNLVLLFLAVRTNAFGPVARSLATTYLAIHPGVCVAVIGLNWWALRKRRSLALYTTVLWLSLVAEVWVTTVGMWAAGSLQGGYSLVFSSLVIVLYRSYYGRKLGLGSLLLVMGFQTGLVTLDAFDVTRSGWSSPDYRPAHGASELLGRLLQCHLFSVLAWAGAAANAKRTGKLRALTQQLQALREPRRRQGPLSATLLDGRYELGALLGRGGTGDVYQARDTEAGGDVAVKVLHPLFSGDKTYVERFRAEADAVARVAADGVPRIHRIAVDTSGHSFLVMDLLEGESLAEAVGRRGALPPVQVTRVIEQLAATLDRVHQSGVVHRDVKPSNVFLVTLPSGELKTYLLDFGVAKLRQGAQALTRSEMLLGTVGYIAPECIRLGSAEATGAADVFSLAAVAYEALAGEPAFSTHDLAAFSYDVLERSPLQAYRSEATLPQGIGEVLARGLAREPADRYARASEFATDLVTVLGASAAEVPQKALTAPALVPGAVVAGRYRLERHLGQGGMGTVWAATHLVTQRAVALKFLRNMDGLRERGARFLREAAAVGSLDHPNVVEVLDCFELDEQHPVIVMELLRGETLEEKLARDGCLDPTLTTELILPVVAALKSAHERGIVHRDLKPANVFLAEIAGERRVKVVDFGLAKFTNPAAQGGQGSEPFTRAGQLLGTPGYMAPEQVLGGPVDHRADVWSLGVMLYECLTGSRPVAGDSHAEFVGQLMNDNIVPLADRAPGLPAELCACVTRMLERDPAARPLRLGEVYDVLTRQLALAQAV